MFWLTLIPEDHNAPVAQVRGNRAGGGAFVIDAQAGPVAGPHTARVILLSNIYPQQGDGTGSLDDAQYWEQAIVLQADRPVALDLAGNAARPVADMQ